jgi:hypothetical protein
MEVIIYREEYNNVDAIDNFVNFYNNINMKYLASDLLERGLSPKQISEAILKAIRVGKSSGLAMEKHFLPVFTQVNSEIISDCKLSQLGYGLLLLNADVELTVVSNWQVSLLESFLE